MKHIHRAHSILLQSNDTDDTIHSVKSDSKDHEEADNPPQSVRDIHTGNLMKLANRHKMELIEILGIQKDGMDQRVCC